MHLRPSCIQEDTPEIQMVTQLTTSSRGLKTFTAIKQVKLILLIIPSYSNLSFSKVITFFFSRKP